MNVWWGGIQFGPNVDTNAVGYMTSVYNWFETERLASAPDFVWPWRGVNIHLHNEGRSLQDVTTDFTNVRNLLIQKNDPGGLIVGEWGLNQQKFNAQPQDFKDLYDRIRANGPDVMFFHAHHGLGDPDPNGGSWGLRIFDDAKMVQGPRFKLTEKFPNDAAGANSYYAKFVEWVKPN